MGALRMIVGVSQDVTNCIGVEAENHGLGYFDEEEHMRSRMLHDFFRVIKKMEKSPNRMVVLMVRLMFTN